MNIEMYRNFCLSLPDVEECFPFGPETLVYKVSGKMFTATDIDTFVSINVKCDPEKALELREEFSAVLPGYHMNKKHWNTIEMDGSISDTLIKEWITDSYHLVKPKLKKDKQNSVKS